MIDTITHMEHLLFIIPPTISHEKFKHPTYNVGVARKLDGDYGQITAEMPLGVLSLSAYLKKHCDIKITLIDFNIVLNKLDSFPYESFENFFKHYLASTVTKTFRPTIVGISTLFSTSYRNMLDIASACRKSFPEALIIGGGGVPTNMYKAIFNDSDDFYCLFYGESERPLRDFVTATNKSKFINNSPQCITKEKVSLGHAFGFDFIKNLDEIPLYDYDLVDLNDYAQNSSITVFPGMAPTGQSINYMGSRGCPFRCVFCSAHSIHGKIVRFHSLLRIREDLMIMRNRYRARTIVFLDDHFMASKERAHEILDILDELDLKAFFPNSLTLYALDKPMLDAMKRVGVNLMILAIESGSERVLKKVMKKPLNLKIVERVVQDCRELNIDTNVNIVIGLPGETKADIEEARRFLKTLNATWFRIYIAIPLPGSEMYNQCIDNGYISEVAIDGDFKTAVIETEEFSAEYIQYMAYTMNLELNFLHNADMRLANHARALLEFENVINIKDDHAFAYYFAALCLRSMGDEHGYVRYRNRYEDICAQSPFWQKYAKDFSLTPLP